MDTRRELAEELAAEIRRNTREHDAVVLLRRAADSLQEYCAAADGGRNDSLAMEIYAFLERV